MEKPVSKLPPHPSGATPRIALYPGTFDGVTLGHVDLIHRAHCLFDRLLVGVAFNERKRPLFTVEERLAMLRVITRELPNVECVELRGLTVHFARQMGAQFIIRGLRAVSDFEFELQMAIMNREMAPGVETIFLAPATEFIFLSSSVVKEVWRSGGDIRPFVPRVVWEGFQRLSASACPGAGKDEASIGSGDDPAATPPHTSSSAKSR